MSLRSLARHPLAISLLVWSAATLGTGQWPAPAAATATHDHPVRLPALRSLTENSWWPNTYQRSGYANGTSSIETSPATCRVLKDMAVRDNWWKVYWGRVDDGYDAHTHPGTWKICYGTDILWAPQMSQLQAHENYHAWKKPGNHDSAIYYGRLCK